MQTYLKISAKEENHRPNRPISQEEFQHSLPLLLRQTVNAIEENEFVRKNGYRFSHLTCREVEVLTLVAKGNTSRQIGSTLSISKHTVDTHRRNIIEKLGLQTICCWQRYANAFGLA